MMRSFLGKRPGAAGVLRHVAIVAALLQPAHSQEESAKDPAIVKSGGKLFLMQCAACHAPTLPEGMPQNLKDAQWLHGSKPDEIAAVITNGVPAKAMPAFGKTLKPAQIEALTAYVLSLQKPAAP